MRIKEFIESDAFLEVYYRKVREALDRRNRKQWNRLIKWMKEEKDN